MNNSCIIAPIHPPFFRRFGVDWVKSYNTYFEDSDIFLIFSNEAEKDDFAKMASDLRYNSIVCDEHIGKSPITQKKFYGLKWIFQNTSFTQVGVADVDSLFIKTVDYDKLFTNYLNNGKVYAGYGSEKIICFGESPSKFFNDTDNAKIKNITADYKLYFWFNDIPIYTKDHFFNFLRYIDYDNSMANLEYIDFSYIIYAHYLLVHDIIKLETIEINGKIVSVPFGVIEQQHHFHPSDFEKIIKKIKPVWLKIPWNLNPEMEWANTLGSVFMQLHVHSPYK